MSITPNGGALPPLTDLLDHFESLHGLAHHQIEWALFSIGRSYGLSTKQIAALFKVYLSHGSHSAVSFLAANL